MPQLTDGRIRIPKLFTDASRPAIPLLFVLLLAAGAAFSQQGDLYQQALKLKNEGRFQESLILFEQLVRRDSSNVEYLTNASFLYCKLGNRKKEEAERQSYFRKAEYLAKKATTLAPDNAEAHYTYALALGRINEYASTKQKIANAKVIKTECDAALRLNPRHPGAYHILGRWHRTVAGFNIVEKGMINAFFGGVPEGGSYSDAIECFSKAVLIEPAVMLHKYELAQTYYERAEGDDYVLCRVWCKKIIGMTPKDEDDVTTLGKARTLLSKVE